MQIVGTHAVAQFSPIRDVCPTKTSSFRLVHNAKMPSDYDGHLQS